ncbi:FAD/NAD(P)-binding protein [Nocardia sp. 2]|uniref:FAD/NAD(P)-binding protein n=1 Tax=Nocardia acididurans TaxID=2802282 RepID=A0ABS1MDW8_9NOCA|nr:FAD/NAD(P)-binding protein [Nocardia acididurans]MBL1078761.1 FAD/NAD(P)-binding protein [Nocardia acididurans]
MHIGIIGAGVAAVGLLDALATGAEGSAHAVTVFDGSEAVWRGRPYQVDAETVRVNAPPPLMSVRAGDMGHYQEWVRGRAGAERYLDPGLGQPLLPRAHYGEYLAETARAAVDALRRAGWQVSVVNAHVTGFATEADRVVLHAGSGARVAVDRVVLGVGSGRPRDHYGLSGTPGYVAEPYPVARTLAGVAADAHVAVIGSGLTAVDIAVTLEARGHRGAVSFLSRGGTLPFVQQRPLALEVAELTPEAVIRAAGERGELSLAALVSLMRAELARYGDDFDSFAEEILSTAAEDPVVRLRRQLEGVDSGHRGLRLLTRAIRVAGPVAWPLLAESERAMLRDKHFRTINSLSSPMVPHNARIILRLLDSGQLRLRSGLRKIEARAAGGFAVSDAARWTAGVVINAVNPSAYTTPQDAEPLVSALLNAGAAELDPAGGLRVDPATRRLLVGDSPDPAWHVLGNLAADSMFIATNPPGLAHSAARLAHTLLERT